ncbi:amino acid adenylation domain-containing protein [Micromonospora sp. NPDC005215]|uniref:amino acid adenylation domain-containing protein n=1 Tax=Micromonospora sp. NPDC005215 TaxID=3157024 RepID=UPI0033A92545
MAGEPFDDRICTVVRNEEDQYSVWPGEGDPPAGWRVAGHRGTRPECLTEIGRIWTDLQPSSLRRDPGLAEVSGVGDASATSLVSRFAAQVHRTPDATAIIDGDRHVTYAQLSRAVDRTADLLRAAGAGLDSVVAVCCPREVALVVAVLASWKAGAAFLPISLDNPPARILSLAAEAGATLMFAGPSLAPSARQRGIRVLRVVEDDGPAAEAGRTIVGGAPENLAYAIFTSGSSGLPKPVGVTHAGVANLVDWIISAVGVGLGERVLHRTSAGFDAAVWEIVAPLVAGGTVVLAPAGAEHDPRAVLRSVAQHGVTVLQVVPSVLRLLVEEPEEAWAGCTALRVLLSGGEVLSGELVAQVRARIGRPVTVWNEYGPTECTINATAHVVGPDLDRGQVPIGTPLPGMRALVLDPGGLPVPVGVPGELHLGGVGVARGYLGQPELTADRFVPDPYGPPGSRLYRTGDSARWRNDLTLEYLGRLDHQLKVNGVRLEPGEIEAVLSEHRAVTGAVVTVADPSATEKRLVASVVVDGSVSVDELRAFLRERLPESHLPSHFRMMDAFPLLPSGKIDRAALVAVPERPRSGAGFVAPRDAAEQLVADTWAALFEVDKVGAFDDFFDLGGNSLQLTRLASRLRAATGERFALRGLFSATTVEAQARLITMPEIH